MAAGLPLLVALSALASPPASPASAWAVSASASARVPICDEDDGAAEESVSVAEPAVLSAAPVASVARAAATRAGLWQNQMSSGCSTAARPAPSLAVVQARIRAAREGGALACFGPDCIRETVPERAGARRGEEPRPLALTQLGALALVSVGAPGVPLARRRLLPPPPRRLLRPPRT